MSNPLLRMSEKKNEKKRKCSPTVDTITSMNGDGRGFLCRVSTILHGVSSADSDHARPV